MLEYLFYEEGLANNTLRLALVDEEGAWTSMDSMFRGCRNLRLPSSFRLPRQLENMDFGFYDCACVSVPEGMTCLLRSIDAVGLRGVQLELVAARLHAQRRRARRNGAFSALMCVFLNAGSLASAVFDEEGNRVASGTGGKYAIVARYHDPGSRLGVVNYAQSHGNANLLMTTSYDWSNWEKVYGDSAAPIPTNTAPSICAMWERPTRWTCRAPRCAGTAARHAGDVHLSHVRWVGQPGETRHPARVVHSSHRFEAVRRPGPGHSGRSRVPGGGRGGPFCGICSR